MYKLSEINNVAQRSFFNQISNGGALLQTTWTSNMNQLGFSPEYAIIRSVVYNTDSTADAQIYTVVSSLNNYESVASFPGSNAVAALSIMPIIVNPGKLIKLNNNPLNTVSFALNAYASDGTNSVAAPGMVAGQNSSILIDVDFIKLKPKTKI